mgnify:CR=1 FL=1
MIRKKRMSKGIAKILSGLLVFGMVAGLVPAVPGGTVHAKAEGESEQNVTAEQHIHCICGTGKLSVEGHTHDEKQTWEGISDLSKIIGEGYYYLTQDVTIYRAWKCPNDVTLCLNGHSITCDASEDVIVINSGKTFTLTDCQENAGKITHNESKTGRGIYNYGGTFQMYEGTISGNTATYGGGVNSTWGKFNMYGGTITGNIGSTAAYSYNCGGGGVYNNGSEFNMYGGVISGNNSEDCGGGVFCHNGGSFNMFGGEITDNKSTSHGGGVYFASTGSFNMKGTVNITKNKVEEIDNNLYLWEGKQVSASGLTSEARIGVTTKVKPTENSPVTITSDSVSVNCFSSDNSDYETAIDENSKVVLKKKPAVEAPSITKQPQPVSVKVGETATFTVEAAGEGLSYQWMVDKKDNAGFVNIDEATSESYTLNAISKEYNGYRYQCMVSNRGGHVMSDCVTLTVTEDAAPTPNPNPTPTPEPNPEPNPTPAPNPTPEATTPTPDPAPATSTPAASTTTAPAAAAPAQVTYDILDGAGSSWIQNTDGSLAIRGSGEISKFREVKVDGVTVDPVNYTVTEGSTIITFKPEYLKSLSAGNHSFELVWTDGTAATNFTVAENTDQSAKSPKTGEDFSMALCTALLMVSCAGLAGIFAKRKRNHAR